jgi:hypothetical protein
MQDWATAIDLILRQENPEDFKNIPKPKIAVPSIPRQFSNTTTMPLCFSTKTEVQKNSSLAVNNSVKIAITYSGNVEAYNRPCKPLVPSSEELKSELKSLVAWSNRIHPDCPIDLKNNELSFLRCQKNLGAVPYAQVGGVVFQPMSPWILMDISKFLMGFEYTEDMFLSELVHELAHFYQSHLSNSAANSTIFYKLEEREWNKVPRLNSALQTKWRYLPEASKKFEQKSTNRNPPANEETSLLEAAIKEKIGSFTLEDEAFYLQSHYLSLIGIHPQVGVKHLFEVWNYQKSRQNFFFPGEIPFEQCLTSYQNGWTNSKGPLLVSPANFVGYHHSFCFLIFEVDRGAHLTGVDYRTRTRPTSKIPWNLVKNEIRKLFNQ